jgi:hypothetical protein
VAESDRREPPISSVIPAAFNSDSSCPAPGFDLRSTRGQAPAGHPVNTGRRFYLISPVLWRKAPVFFHTLGKFLISTRKLGRRSLASPASYPATPRQPRFSWRHLLQSARKLSN